MTAFGNMTLGKMPSAPSMAAPQERQKMKPSVVIPAYNEEDGIANIIERVLNVRPAVKQVGIAELELIVVDDGSKDRTAEIVRSYPDVRLIQHAKNRNYGGALKLDFITPAAICLRFSTPTAPIRPNSFRACARKRSKARTWLSAPAWRAKRMKARPCAKLATSCLPSSSA